MTTYEREWFVECGLPPRTRLRVGLTKRGGHPIAFLIQLEYRHAGEWLVVARSEHDVHGPIYRNVERSGTHVDLHKPDGSQHLKLTDFPPEPANEAMATADEFLRDNAEAFVERFERWL